MNTKFNIKQIAQIATKLRQYKKLYVTTEGQMFTSQADAEEAVRVKNMIIDDQNNYVGVVELTEDAVTDVKLKTYAKDVEAFGQLFESAKIPVTKKKPQHERKREDATPDDKNVVASVAAALGAVETPTEKAIPEVEKPKPLEKK